MPDGRQESPNVLSDHVRRGRRYMPRLAAIDGFTANDWVRDDAPDLLWPLMLVSVRGTEGAAAFGRFQDAVVESVGRAKVEQGAVTMDGRLTSLEAVPQDQRDRLKDVIGQLDRVEIVPDLLVAALSLYDDVPGAWLLLESRDMPEVTGETALQAMADALIEVVSDRHLNALVKAAPFGWGLRSGRVHIPAELATDLVDYPAVEDTRAKADAFILSSFLALKSMEELDQPSRQSARLRWAKSYWRTNWAISECVLRGDLDASTHDPDADDSLKAETQGEEDLEGDGGSSDTSKLDQVIRTALADFDNMVSRLEEAVFDRGQAVDLHSPARHEVLTGFGMRACRATAALLLTPRMWTGEHAAGVMRYLAEATIVLKWMQTEGSDDAFRDFQDYGRGKQKLQLRHLRATVDSSTEEPDEFVASMISEMNRKSGGEWSEEVQEVSVEATFSGLSLRQMARDVGERDLYNHIFQPTSGVSHGEWWSLEEYALQRCLNPLHRFHNVPEFSWGVPAPHPQFPDVLLASLERVLSTVIEGLNENPGEG